MTGARFEQPGVLASALTFIGLVILIGLGTWQVQRLHWKQALLATIERQLAADPVLLPAMIENPEDWNYRPVMATGTFRHDQELYLHAINSRRGPGYQVITPFVRDDRSATILVNRGWVPQDKRLPDTRTEGQIKGRTTITGLARQSRVVNAFTPDDDIEGNVWYAANVEKMAAALNIDPVAPLFIEADATENPGGLPVGGQTRIHIPNDHLQYAITWYSLAIVLLVIFGISHMKKPEPSV